MKNDVANVWESIAPTQKWCRFFGLWCFQRDYDGSYRRAFKHTADSVLYLTLFACLVAAWIPNRTTKWDAIKDSMLVEYLFEIYLTILPAAGFYSFVIVQIIAQTKIRAFMAIDKVDECIKAMGCRRALREVNLHVWKFSILVSTGAAITTMSWFAITFFGNRNHVLSRWYQPLTYTIAYLVHVLVISQFVIWCEVLGKRFKLLRTALLNGMVTESHSTAEYPDNEVQFIMDIKAVAAIHYRLAEIARRIVYAYSFSLFVQVVVYFILFLCEGYMLLYILTLGDHHDYSTIMDACYYTIAPGIELLALVHIASSLCNQVKLTNSISGSNQAGRRSDCDPL